MEDVYNRKLDDKYHYIETEDINNQDDENKNRNIRGFENNLN